MKGILFLSAFTAPVDRTRPICLPLKWFHFFTPPPTTTPSMAVLIQPSAITHGDRFSGPRTQTLTLVSWGHMLTWGGPECSHLPAFQPLQGSRSVKECLSPANTHAAHPVSFLIVKGHQITVGNQGISVFTENPPLTEILDPQPSTRILI